MSAARVACTIALAVGIWAAGTTAAQPPKVLHLRNADSGRTIHLRHGTTIAVTLGPDGLVWAQPASSNTHLVARVSFSDRRLSGVRATLHALRPGRATLSSTGHCPPATPGHLSCALILAWKVSLVVS